MSVYISQKEYDKFIEKLAGLEKEKEGENKKLGKIMETSGSFASKTPGFNETESHIKILNQKIFEIKKLLSGSKILKDASELKKDKITIYSLVTVIDLNNNEEIRYYIQHDFGDGKKDFMTITPFSPIGKNLMGKKIGDEVSIELPREDLKLKIINIEKKFL